MVGQIAPADRVTQNGHWEKGRLALSLQTIEEISVLIDRLITLTELWQKEIESRLAKEVAAMSDEEIRQLPDDTPFIGDFDVSRPRSWDF